MLVTIADDTKVLHFIQDLSGNLEHPEEALDIGPLVLGNKCSLYYVSLLLEENGEKLKRENYKKYAEDLLDKDWRKILNKNEKTEICPYCGFNFQRLLRHLSSSGSCKEKASEAFIEELKVKAKKNQKASKAKSQKNIRTHESFDAREDRLAMQSYCMMKRRIKQKEEKGQKFFQNKKSTINKNVTTDKCSKPRKSCAQIILDALEKKRQEEKGKYGDQDRGLQDNDRVQSMMEL